MAGYSRGRANVPNFSIRTIWGLAKSPELSLDDEELHSIVYRETGKESIRALTQGEINKVCSELSRLKDSVKKGNGGQRQGMATDNQLYLVKKLEEELGWADNPKRLKAFMLKYYNRASVKWLTFKEASRLIESLKKMKQKGAKEGNESSSLQG